MKKIKINKDIYSVSSLQRAMPWIFLVLGIGIAAFGIWFPFDDHSKIREMLKIVGGSLISGGIFTYLVRYSQVMGIVKTELEEIIYDTKHLRLRKDLDVIWEKVSKEVFKNKFNKINKSVLKDIKEQYFPTNHVAYYDEYKQWIDIDLHAEDTQTIMVTNKCRFVLIPSTKDKLTYEFQNSLTFNNSSDEVSYSSSYIKVNNVTIQHEAIPKVEDKKLVNRILIELDGSEKYEIERVEIKKYSIKSDNIIAFTPQFITNSFECTISHPTTIKINLQNCGTLSSFNTLHEQVKNGQKMHRFAYNSVLFPNQGYFAALNYIQ